MVPSNCVILLIADLQFIYFQEGEGERGKTQTETSEDLCVQWFRTGIKAGRDRSYISWPTDLPDFDVEGVLL